MRRVSQYGIGIAVLLLAGLSAFAQENPQALVSTVVNNELHSQKQPHYWMYLDHNTEHGKAEVKRTLQLPQCWFTWPISVDGHPASQQEQDKARKENQELLNDRQLREKKRKEIDEDATKANSLLKILPDAFIFTPAGHKAGATLLKFRPNPKYDPPSNEAKVFHAMAGTLVVSDKEKRLEKLTGKLTHNVDFGWGILGKIDKGGTFVVVQSEVAPGDWELTLLDVHISGKALFFHTIGEQQHESMTDFKPVPTDISLQRAAKMVESPASPPNSTVGQ